MISIGFLHTPSGSVGGSPLPSQTILTSNQSAALNTTTLKFSVPSGNSLTVYWGDGNYDAVTCDGTLKTLTHDYSSQDTYQISLSGNLDQITKLHSFSQTWVEGDLANLSSLTGLSDLRLYNTSVSGNIANTSGMTNLDFLYLYGLTGVVGDISNLSSMSIRFLRLEDTSVSGNLSSLSGLTGMISLYLYGTSIVGDISNLSGMTNIVNLYLYGLSGITGDLSSLAPMSSASNIVIYGTSIDDYTSTTLPAWSNANLEFFDLGLDSVEVDDFLNDLDAAGGTNGTLNISGTNAAHSTASDTAISNLETDGWTVTRNDPIITSNQISALNTTTIQITLPATNTMTIDWGDGSSESVTADGVFNTYTHDYTTQEKWGIRFIGDYDKVTQFKAANQAYVEGNLSEISVLSSVTYLNLPATGIAGNLSDVSGLTGLIYLHLALTPIVGSISSLSTLSSLENLYLYSTSATGALSTISGLTSLRVLNVFSSSISGDIADIAPLTALIQTYLYGSNVDTYTQGTLPTWTSNDIRIYDLGLDSVEVDDFLNDLDAAGGTNGTLNIGGTNAAHSTASDTGLSNLETDGWTIDVNEPLFTSNQVSALNQTSVQTRLPGGNSATIRWGDGTTTAMVADNTVRTYTHDYSTQEKWGVDFTGDITAVDQLRVFNQSWVEGTIGDNAVLTGLVGLYYYSTSMSGNLSGISGLTSLTLLQLYNSSITGSISSLSSMTSMIQLRLNDMSITGALSNISGMTSLTYLNVSNTSVSGDIASAAPMSSLTQLLLNDSSIDTYTGGTSLPAWGSCTINVRNLGLTTVEVDDFIIDLEDGGGNGTNGTLTIDGTNAARSNASDTAKANLETDGWTVTVNEPLFTSNQVSALNTTTMYVLLPSGKSGTIRWGDGNTTALTASGSLETYTHDYSSQEKWGVDITGDVDEIDQFRVYSQSWVEGKLADLDGLTGCYTLYLFSTGFTGNLSDISSLPLQYLQLYSTSITGAISSLSSMTGMLQLHLSGLSVTGGITDVPNRANVTYLNLSGTSITGNITGLSTMTNVVSLYLNGTALTGDLAVIANLTSATTIYLNDTSCDQYTGSTALPPFGSAVIHLEDNGLSSTEVDDFLIDLEDGGNNGNNGTLNIAGTNAARTSASDTAYNNLVTDGWTITVNT